LKSGVKDMVVQYLIAGHAKQAALVMPLPMD
jgi:hypothetical protein